MPRIKKRGPGHRERWRHALDLPQEIGLVIGPMGQGFESEGDARAAWALHRERIMAEHPRGSRALAWWAFEAGEPRPTRSDRELPFGWKAESVRLAERGDLMEPEFQELARTARRVGHPRRWGDSRLEAFLNEMRDLNTDAKGA